MVVILHMDDGGRWLDILLKRKEDIAAGLGREVTILCRPTVYEARAVIEGADPQMLALVQQGHKLDAVILDLMMEGGTEPHVMNWLQAVKELAGADRPQKLLGEDRLAQIDRRCRAVAAGRLAAEKGARVVILTNAEKFTADIDADTERGLIMAACGASAYITKTAGDWLAELLDALAPLKAK